MSYAIIKFQGHQYQVEPNQVLIVDRVNENENQKITIDDVLLVKNGKKVLIGQPKVKNAKVIAEIIEHFKGEKIRVTKFRPKTRYRRVKGFRPQLTKVKINDIEINK